MGLGEREGQGHNGNIGNPAGYWVSLHGYLGRMLADQVLVHKALPPPDGRHISPRGVRFTAALASDSTL